MKNKLIKDQINLINIFHKDILIKRKNNKNINRGINSKIIIKIKIFILLISKLKKLIFFLYIKLIKKSFKLKEKI